MVVVFLLILVQKNGKKVMNKNVVAFRFRYSLMLTFSTSETLRPKTFELELYSMVPRQYGLFNYSAQISVTNFFGQLFINQMNSKISTFPFT